MFIKKNISIGIILLSLICFSQEPNTGIAIGSLHISKIKPQQGDLILVTYKKIENITSSFISYSVNNKTYLDDLDLTEQGNICKAAIKIPDSATTIAFHFLKGYKLEQLHKGGYLIPIHDSKGNLLPGALSGKAMYLSRFNNDYDLDIDMDSIIALIDQDIKQNPEVKDFIAFSRAVLINSKNKEEGQIEFKKLEKSLISKNDLTVKDLHNLRFLYYALGQKDKQDSIQNVGITKFPNSVFGANAVYQNFTNAADKTEMEKITMEFKSRFPKHENLKYILKTMATQEMKEGNLEKFMSYTNDIDDAIEKAKLYHSAARELIKKDAPLEQIEEFYKKSIMYLNEGVKNPLFNPEIKTKSQYIKFLDEGYQSLYDLHAIILFKKGDIKNALATQQNAVKNANYSDYNERYIDYLMADNQYEKVQELATDYLKNKVGTKNIEKQLEIAYLKNNNTESFQSFIKKLNSSLEIDELEALRLKLINEKIEDFTLKTIDGNDITLSQLKGKTVILDFWATWCAPCKASFPGMQMALTNYKNDTSVVFLFIDTLEREKSKDKLIKNISNFISENNYDFTVLLDDEAKCANKYGVTGIPAKFIIGPDGNIKFKSTGFGGSAENLAKELGLMIELARTNK